MQQLIRRLAEMEPGEVPMLTAYLDMRPHATGETPAIRSGLVRLQARLQELEKTLLPRGEALDSFRQDAAALERYLEREFSPSSHGLAVFACATRGVFEAVEVGVPFSNQVSLGPVPDLFQLAKLLDEQKTAIVAVVDSNTAGG